MILNPLHDSFHNFPKARKLIEIGKTADNNPIYEIVWITRWQYNKINYYL